MKTTITIASGPSREELFDGLRLFIEKRVINFNFKKNGTEIKVPLIIQGIEAEDGSGESWIIKFAIDYKKFIVYPLFCGELASNSVDLKSKAYYSTKNRTGTILN